MPTEKTPIRAVFDNAVAIGLSEYQVTEVVGVAFGGIGTDTLTANSILLGNTTSAIQSSSIQIIGTTLSSTDSTIININEGLVVEGNLTVTGSITGTILTGTIANTSLTNSSFTLADDSSSTTTISLGETLKITGGSGIDTSISGDTLTIALESTIVTETSSDTLTNKSISLSTNTITGTLAEFNTAVSDADLVSLAGSETLTNKTISGSSNTLTNIANSSLTNSGFTLADGSSTTTLISLGETLKISGTSNEIETAVSGDTITIGLPSDVTIGNNLTVTGNLTVSGTTTTVNSTTIEITNSFTFEGATANDFETVLGVIDPTADRAINLPNVSGTVITTGNLSDITGLSNSQLSNPSFTIVDDSSTTTTISLGESLLLAGGTGITSVISGDSITFNIDNTVATLTGTETFTNKTLTSPKINENVVLTATATELNFTDGVTSGIQTQIDAKASRSFAIAQAVALG